MKKLLLFGFLFFSWSFVHALTPVSALNERPESSYAISQSTISVSSNTVTTIDSVLGYRLAVLGNPTSGTTVYYRMDGSTESIPTVGDWFVANQKGNIESNGEIYLQLGNAVSSIILRFLEIRK